MTRNVIPEQTEVNAADYILKGSLDDYAKDGQIGGRFAKMLMLPHSNIWSVLVVFTIICHSEMTIVYLTYKPNYKIYLTIHYIFEGIFGIDTIFNCLHRNFSSHKSDLCTRKRPFCMLLIGLASLIPVQEMYVYLLDGEKTADLNLYFNLKVMVRLLQVFHFFFTMRREAGINQLLVIFSYGFFLYTLYTASISCAWYYFGCYNCPHETSWMQNLRDFDYDPNNFVHKVLFPIVFIGGIAIGSYGGVLKDETLREHILVIATMIFFIILKIMTLMSQLTCQFITLHQKQCVFNGRLNNIYKYIDTQNFDHQLVKDIKEFYNALWHKRRAIPTMPPCFEILPLALRKEVAVDIFWDAFKHSHLFRDVDVTFKRELALIMKSEFMLAGDFLYNNNEKKTKMVYLVSGIVQILSDEDDESPIVSFSSGTVISETACLMVTRSNCSIRCATYCELQTLSVTDLFRRMLRFRMNTAHFVSALNLRIERARMLHLKNKEIDSGLSRPIRRLKNNWRTLFKDKPLKNTNEEHSIEYLDLFVLSDELDLKVEVICLTSTFPFILDPDSSFRNFCDMMCLCAVILQSIIVPYCASFIKDISSRLNTFCFMLDFVYVFDIILQTTTAIKEKDLTIATFGGILSRRLRQFSFIADVIATIPFDYLSLVQHMSPQKVIRFKLNRTIKIYKIMKLTHKYERALGMNVFVIKFIKYYVLYLIIIYFSTCFIYAIACYEEECAKFSNQLKSVPTRLCVQHLPTFVTNVGLYVPNNKHTMRPTIICSTLEGIGTDLKPVPDDTSNTGRHNKELSKWKWDLEAHPALRTWFVVVQLIQGTGTGENYAYRVLDALVMFVVTFVGTFLLIFCLSELTSAIYWSRHEERNHRILLTSVLNYARIHKISSKVIFRIGNMLRFRWEYSRDLIKYDAGCTYDETPKNLKERITYSLITKFLMEAPFFQGMNEKVVKQIAQISTVIAFPPQSYLIFADRIIDNIYLIKRGYMMSESLVPGDMGNNTARQLRTAGDFFPVIEVLHEINSFITVKAITAVETIAVPYTKMMTFLKMHDKEYGIVMECLKNHLADNFSVLTRAECRMHIRAVAPTRKHGRHFTYVVPSESQRHASTNPGKRWYSQFFLGTFYSKSKFFIVYECTRCFLAVFQFILVVCYINLFFEYRRIIEYLTILLDATVWFDIWMRMRVWYYNENGLLEKDFWKTVQYYSRSAMYVDMVSSCPFYHIQLSQILSNRIPTKIRALCFLITRPLQLYRVFHGLSYITSDVKSEILLVYMKLMIYLSVILLLNSNFIMLWNCDIDESTFICENAPWIGTSLTTIDNTNALQIYAYVTLQYFTTTTFEPVSEPTDSVYLFFALLAMFFVCISRFFYSDLISSGLYGEYMTSQIQNDRRNFRNFAKRESVEMSLAADMLATNEYLTRDVVHYAMEQAESRFTPQLNDDFAYALNRRALENTVLLHKAPEAFVRFLSSRLQRRFFKKGGTIIRHNDVHDLLYVVKKGGVEISIANCKITTLRMGGVFGCFARYGFTRQTVKAIACFHTEVLVIKSSGYHKLVAKLPKLRSRVERFMLTGQEYLNPVTELVEDMRDMRASSMARAEESHPSMIAYGRLVNITFNQGSTAFKIFDYLLSVHLSAWSSLMVQSTQLFAMYDSNEPALRWVLYTFDIIFLSKIFLGFTLTYVDEHSGVIIMDYATIVKRYLKTHFVLDVLTVIPFELFVSSVEMSIFSHSLFLSNRILRIFFLIRYYRYYKRDNKLRHHLRWTTFIYLVWFYLQLFFGLWNYATCFKGFFCEMDCGMNKCKVRTDLSQVNIKYVYSNSTINSISHATSYVLNNFIAVGLRNTHPMDQFDIFVTILLTLTSVYITAEMASAGTVIQVIDNFSLGKYYNDIEGIKTYLQYQSLSAPIFKKVCEYYMILWKVQAGEQIPALIEDATEYLRQDVMYDIYSHHLLNHGLFKNCHVDFLRQLMVHFKRCIYPNDYVIAEKGDMDRTMYFIHSGVVNVVQRVGYQRIVLEELKKNDSFGEQQGLTEIPHKNTYIAKTFVDIVMLDKLEWKYLLKFFPASVEEITEKAIEFDYITTELSF